MLRVKDTDLLLKGYWLPKIHYRKLTDLTSFLLMHLRQCPCLCQQYQGCKCHLLLFLAWWRPWECHPRQCRPFIWASECLQALGECQCLQDHLYHSVNQCPRDNFLPCHLIWQGLVWHLTIGCLHHHRVAQQGFMPFPLLHLEIVGKAQDGFLLLQGLQLDRLCLQDRHQAKYIPKAKKTLWFCVKIKHLSSLSLILCTKPLGKWDTKRTKSKLLELIFNKQTKTYLTNLLVCLVLKKPSKKSKLGKVPW